MGSKVLQRSGKFTLSAHAKERVRQRVGISSTEAALAWVNESIANATKTYADGHKTHYITDAYNISCDGLRVITIVPTDNHVDYLMRFGDVVAKEARKLLTRYRRELRKAEIKVAELTLNYLKAKSPKVRDSIKRNLTNATDEKAKLEDEIKAIEIAADKYRVKVQ